MSSDSVALLNLAIALLTPVLLFLMARESWRKAKQKTPNISLNFSFAHMYAAVIGLAPPWIIIGSHSSELPEILTVIPISIIIFSCQFYGIFVVLLVYDFEKPVAERRTVDSVLYVLFGAFVGLFFTIFPGILLALLGPILAK